MTLKSGINERESVNIIHNIKKRRRRRKNFDRIDHENLKYKISIKKILFKILLSILENETRESQYPQTNSNRSWSVNVRLPESFDQTPVMVPRLSRSPRPESLPLLDFPRPVHCSRVVQIQFPPVLLRHRGLSRWKRFDERLRLWHWIMKVSQLNAPILCAIKYAMLCTYSIDFWAMLNRFEK